LFISLSPSKAASYAHYVPTELARLFEQVGFSVEHVWGGTAGNWGRRKIQLDEIEVMVVARKGK
jgi:hypothetical protein